MIRSVIFWFHLVAGACGGIVILVMAGTGVLLSSQKVVTALAERQYAVAAPEPEGADGSGARRADPALLLEAARQTLTGDDGALRAVTLRYDRNPRAPVRLDAGDGSSLYLDPYAGVVLGPGFARLDAFFEAVEEWHRWFSVSGGSVRRARAVTGAANALLLVLLLTGPVLWFPRPFSRKRLRASIVPKRGSSGALRDFSWHRAVGFWAALPLLVIALSGLTLSYPAVGDRLYPVAGSSLPLGSIAGPADAALPPSSAGVTTSPGLDAVLATAESAVPEWRSLVLFVPEGEGGVATVEVRSGRSGQPQKIAALEVALSGGEPVSMEVFDHFDSSQKGLLFFRFAHTGEYWGTIGQAAAAAASLGAMGLACTGLALAGRRLRRVRFLRPRVKRPQERDGEHV